MQASVVPGGVEGNEDGSQTGQQNTENEEEESKPLRPGEPGRASYSCDAMQSQANSLKSSSSRRAAIRPDHRTLAHSGQRRNTTTWFGGSMQTARHITSSLQVHPSLNFGATVPLSPADVLLLSNALLSFSLFRQHLVKTKSSILRSLPPFFPTPQQNMPFSHSPLKKQSARLRYW